MSFTKAQVLEIRQFMQEQATYHVDWLTNEVNATPLAEDACEHFDAYVGPVYDIPEEFFDLSQKEADFFEAVHLHNDREDYYEFLG